MNIPFIKKSRAAAMAAAGDPSLLPPNLKNFFIAVLILKVASAAAAWQFHDPWGLGFVVPLLFMCGYVIYGAWAVQGKRHSVWTVYGDSCYYLGFVFTIASIILAMADFSSADLDIGEISIRFSAAMVTTAFGMAVRVYCVTFGQDEDQLVSALTPRAAGETASGPASNSAPDLKQVAPGAPMTVVLEVTASNLSAFNRALADSCVAFSRSRTELLSLAGGIKKDLEIANAETQNAIKMAQQSLQASTERFEKALDQLIEETSRSAEETLETCQDSMRDMADEAKNAMKKSSDSMTKAFAKAETGISEQVERMGRQVDESAASMKAAGEKISQATEAVAKNIDSGELSAAFKDVATDFKNSSVLACGEMKRSADALASSLSDISAALDTVRALKDMGAITVAIKDISKSSGELKESFNDVAEELKKPLYKKLF